MATFIGEKAEFFKQFLTAEECERTAWNELLSDIRLQAMLSVGGAIWKFPPYLACFNALFNAYITCHEFEELVTQ